MQYSLKNFMRIIGNDHKNNGQNFGEILERIIGKISSIIGTGLGTIPDQCHAPFGILYGRHHVNPTSTQCLKLPRKNRLIKHGDWIEYGYKPGRKNCFNL